MTKAELVNAIAMQTGYDKTTILNVVEGAMMGIKNSLAEGENVYLRGFGSFVTKQRAEKLARNIARNTTVKVPARRVASFKPSDEFNAKLNLTKTAE